MDHLKEVNLDRKKYRIQLLTEFTAIMCSTIFFSKLIFLNHYPKFNLPIKLFFGYVYTATLDPLVVGSSYWMTRRYEYNRSLA